MDKSPYFEISAVEERRALGIPLALTALTVSIGLMIYAVTDKNAALRSNAILITGVLSILYIILLIFLLPRYHLAGKRRYLVTAIHAMVIAWIFFVENRGVFSYAFLIFIITIIGSVVFTGRWVTYFYSGLSLILIGIANLLFNSSSILVFQNLAVITIVITIAANETIHILKSNIQRQVNRLKTLNQITQTLASSIEYRQVVTAMATAIQDTLDADTYYIGSSDGQTITLALLFDDGQFYQDITYDKDNTLAGWVIDHQKSILLTDLPKQINTLGVTLQTIGNPNPSLSWMGTPLSSHDRQYGLVAVGAYKKNAFDQADLSLLENFVQQSKVSLDNAFHHHEIEKKSTEDSLTGALNHGYFLKTLSVEAEKARTEGYPLSLIMLDIDFFKKYNDCYGHLIGDLLLTNLTAAILQHIKSTDHVGRWGGEEFVIALPNATREQTIVIANRIRETLAGLSMLDRENKTIPPPTISQGIAGFPSEVDQIFSLIDLADQRLYIAKKRGRDQIESSPISGKGSDELFL
jgi:diguanylate cyclase (GGDEF)-like protein